MAPEGSLMDDEPKSLRGKELMDVGEGVLLRRCHGTVDGRQDSEPIDSALPQDGES